MQRKHYLSLDGLRGVAAISVVFFHRRWWGPSGHFLDHAYLAVNFFFILSGLVIDHAYVERLRDRMTFGKFAVTRIIRLYPVIVIGSIIGLAYHLLIASMRHNHAAIVPALAGGFLSSLCLPSPSWWGGAPFFIDQPLWSLFFELIANIVFAVVLFRASTRTLAILVAAGFVASIAMVAEVGSLNVANRPGELLWGLLCVFPPFILGMLLNRVPEINRLPSFPFWLASLVLVLSFVLNKITQWSGVYELAMVFGLYPVLILAARQNNPNGKWVRIAQWSAYVSYPLYAIHDPLLDWISRPLEATHLPGLIMLAVAVTSAVLFAYAVAKYVDEPVREWLSGRLRAQTAAAGGGVHPDPLTHPEVALHDRI
jgi:peptidoglycan/LPS O-acetylase OafA/YrhL